MLSNAVFAYGTLMSGQSRHHWLQAGGILTIQPASVPGVLLHLGAYPGLQLSANASRQVFGEYIRLQHMDAMMLSELDREERISP